MYRGLRKELVDMELFVDGTGDLIEGGEKNAKEDVEEIESAGGTDVPEEGIYYSWDMNKTEVEPFVIIV